MNKLYILGALLLSSAEAGKLINAVGTDSTAAITWGSYTYSVSGDCVPTSGTTLGLNNKYYQYYSFTLAAGSQAWALVSPTFGGATNFAGTISYKACYHTHLANWMATPAITTPAAISGLGNQAVAYGYVLSGTAVTSCVNTIATATLYSSTAKTFLGAQYQNSAAYVQGAATTTSTSVQTTIATSIRVKQGLENYDTVTVKISAIAITGLFPGTATAQTEGAITTATANTNYYWDFMQTNVFQGMTQFGRGGGSTTAPCGWWVIYALEAPGAVTNQLISNANGYAANEDNLPALAGVTVSLWTDNSIMTVASSIVLSALATILF